MRRHRVYGRCCPSCNRVLTYRRERRIQLAADAAYLLTWLILLITAPFNPRAWKKFRS